MSWYYILLIGILIGVIFGLIISRYLPATIQYKGKIKQKGQNNTMSVTKEEKLKKRRLFKRKRTKK